MTFLKTLASAAALTLAAVAAHAQNSNPAVIFDRGGKFDKSFNQASYEGAERFKEETGIGYAEFELQQDAQREQALRRFAEKGYNPVVVAGFSNESAMATVAAEYPDTKFVLIDAVVDLPNVRSVIFNEHEGSYLVGMLAAMASETGKIGFVGGMDIPLIKKFACGYVQGAKSVNPDIEVFQNMTGTTPEAWNSPLGGEIAQSQIGQGADVIFPAAGGTGIFVLQAAADADILGIGVDSNQNYLHPDNMLTSMLKRVDLATYEAMMDVEKDQWSAGVQIYGIDNDGVGYAVDENNQALITPEMTEAVEAAKAKIISGEIKVHNYEDDDSCPVM